MPSLASCGGSSGSTASTPPPTYATLASGTGVLTARSVLANSSRISGASTATSTVSRTGLEIAYNSSTQTYSLRAVLDPRVTRPNSADFGPAELQAAKNLGLTGYDATTSSNGDTFVNRLQLNLVGLTYADVGHWQTGIARADGSQNFSNLYFSYGIQTKADDVPKSGTGSYAVSLVGAVSGANIGGSGAITANFGAATVSVELAPTYIYGPGRVSQVGTLSGSGAITANSFAANLTGGSYAGDVEGLFYGPQAQEIGGTVTFSSPSVSGGEVSSGAFAGKRN
ncbi:MAG: transferrin-binding protein-like solute binding protein [Novosphingobium sp.]